MTVKSKDNVIDNSTSNDNDLEGSRQSQSSKVPSPTVIRERLKKMIMTGSFCGTSDDGDENDTVLKMKPIPENSSSESDNVMNKPSPLNTGIEWLDSLELEYANTDNKVDVSLSSPSSVVDTEILQRLPPSGVPDKIEGTADIKINADIDWNGSSSSENEAPCLSLCTTNNSIRSIPRSVSFAESVVTHVRETPRYNPEDVHKMFYSRKDIQRLVCFVYRDLSTKAIKRSCTNVSSDFILSTNL